MSIFHRELPSWKPWSFWVKIPILEEAPCSSKSTKHHKRKMSCPSIFKSSGWLGKLLYSFCRALGPAQLSGWVISLMRVLKEKTHTAGLSVLRGHQSRTDNPAPVTLWLLPLCQTAPVSDHCSGWGSGTWISSVQWGEAAGRREDCSLQPSTVPPFHAATRGACGMQQDSHFWQSSTLLWYCTTLWDGFD